MELLHDLHSDDMILLGSISLFSGVAVGALARLALAGFRKGRPL